MKPDDVVWRKGTEYTRIADLVSSSGVLFHINDTPNSPWHNGERAIFYTIKNDLKSHRIAEFEMRCLIECAVGNQQNT